jgi:hypothetical protein
MPNKGKDLQDTEINLGEEEICDISLATFYLFDKENAGILRLHAKGHNGGCSVP